MDNHDYQLLCEILIRRYCEQLNIKKVPRVFSTQESFNKADTCGGTKLGEGKLKASGHYGLYCDECNIIFSNPDLCDTVKMIDYNIAHELVHAKWFHTMNHGKRYDKRVDLIISGKEYV